MHRDERERASSCWMALGKDRHASSPHWHLSCLQPPHLPLLKYLHLRRGSRLLLLSQQVHINTVKSLGEYAQGPLLLLQADRSDLSAIIGVPPTSYILVARKQESKRCSHSSIVPPHI